MVSKKKPIDRNSKKKLLGRVISICDVYYPLSYWYVYDSNEFTVTLIGLDNEYKPFINNPKIIQIELGYIQYNVISVETEVVIEQNYLKNFYQNRITLNKKPRYGDIILLESFYEDCFTFLPVPFFVLNYDPLSGSHLLFEISYTNYDFYEKHNQNLILELCDFNIISNKEIRRDIIEKQKKIKLSLEKSNYNELNNFDEIIRFNVQMNFLSEKTQLNEMKLIDLDFLRNEKLDCLEIEKEYQPMYNYWETNTIINNDILSCYYQNNDENYINNFINNEDYRLLYTYNNNDLIKLYDSDDEINLKNSETFDGLSFDSSIDEQNQMELETIPELETEEEVETIPELETEEEVETIPELETEKEVETIPELETEEEVETIQEVETVQEVEVETVIETEEVEVKTELELEEDFENLEKNDFEPYYKESGCSVM